MYLFAQESNFLTEIQTKSGEAFSFFQANPIILCVMVAVLTIVVYVNLPFETKRFIKGYVSFSNDHCLPPACANCPELQKHQPQQPQLVVPPVQNNPNMPDVYPQPHPPIQPVDDPVHVIGNDKEDDDKDVDDDKPREMSNKEMLQEVLKDLAYRKVSLDVGVDDAEIQMVNDSIAAIKDQIKQVEEIEGFE